MNKHRNLPMTDISTEYRLYDFMIRLYDFTNRCVVLGMRWHCRLHFARYFFNRLLPSLVIDGVTFHIVRVCYVINHVSVSSALQLLLLEFSTGFWFWSNVELNRSEGNIMAFSESLFHSIETLKSSTNESTPHGWSESVLKWDTKSSLVHE